jgi:outer membrane protein assembly factor BamB
LNANGTLKWEQALSYQLLYSSAAIGFDGTVYVGARTDSLYAFDPDNGNIKWKFGTNDEIRGSAAVGSDGSVYVASNDDSLYCVSPIDGSKIWATSIGGNDEGGMAIGSDGTIYIGSSSDSLYSVNPENGSINWKFNTPGGDVLAAPVIGVDGTIYVGSRNDSLYAINNDGTEKWRFFAGDEVRSTAAIDKNGIIYFGSYDDNVYGIRDDGTQATQVFGYLADGNVWSPITITSEGTLLFGSALGSVYSVTPTNSAGLANTPWPKRGRDNQHKSRANLVWNGSVNTDWSNTSNWSFATVPTASDNISIPDLANDPIISSSATVNHIEVSSGATITINSRASLAILGDASGNAIIKRNTASSDGYSIVGAPVLGDDLSSLVTQGVNIIYDYNGTVFVPTNSGAMLPGKGYFTAQVGVATPSIEMTGALVSGDVNAIVSAAGDGFNILANPYAAAISASSLIAGDASSNVTTGSIYIWEDGGSNNGGDRNGSYVVVNDMGAADFSNIGSVQGFFVQADNGGDLTFSPDMQVTTAGANADGNFYRKASNEKQILRLSVSGNNLYHETIIGFVGRATYGRDYALDAQYLKGNELISFYSMIEDVKFATQGLPFVDSDPIEVDLGMDLAEAGTYRISVEEFSGFSENLSITLIDEMTGQFYQLNSNFEFTFTTGAVVNARQFKVIVAPLNTLAINQLVNKLEVIGGASELTIRFASNKAERVNIFSLGGKSVFSGEVMFINNQAVIQPQINRNQVYVLRVNDQSIKFLLK